MHRQTVEVSAAGRVYDFLENFFAFLLMYPHYSARISWPVASTSAIRFAIEQDSALPALAKACSLASASGNPRWSAAPIANGSART